MAYAADYPTHHGPAGDPALAELTLLASGARRGDPVARAALLNRLTPLVRGAAARAAVRARHLGLETVLGADDLQQEARAILLRLMDGYREEAGAPLPYFTFRLRAKLEQHLRREARRPAGRRMVWDSEATQALVDALGPADILPPDVGGALGTALNGALLRLSPRQRRLIHLAYWRDWSDQEIGARLHIGTGAARQARYRALRSLRAGLEPGSAGRATADAAPPAAPSGGPAKTEGSGSADGTERE